jgi:EthD domain
MEAIIYAVRCLPTLSSEEFHRYWLNTHGPLARKHLKALGASRYVQVHTVDDPINELLKASRGITEEPYDGIVVVTGDREKVIKAMSTDKGHRAMAELIEDEKNFIDFSRSAIWIAQEHVIFESK